jgi:hypothetical protein
VTIVELGDMDEFLGSILTIGTLAYLAVGIRKATGQQWCEVLISVQQGQNSAIAQLRDPHVFGAYVRTAGGRDPSIEDWGTAIAWVVQYLNHFQIVHELYWSGAMKEKEYPLWGALRGSHRW